MIGTPEGTRTPDPLLRRQLLYPPELQARMERVMGMGDAPNISLCIIAQNVWGVKPFF